MTDYYKELLISEIGARMPFGVKFKHFIWDEELGEIEIASEIYSINRDGYIRAEVDYEEIHIDMVQLYLFPISSMSKSQLDSFLSTCNIDGQNAFWTEKTYKWLNKYHFDYRKLIDQGLALDATELNIY